MSARDEIRVSEFGLLRCPSCGQLAAEILMTGHCLVYEFRGEGSNFWVQAECRDGGAIGTRDYDVVVAITNIALADDVNFREKQHYRWLYYPREGGFGGLLSILET